MRITKYTHACVRIEHEGRVLVIDPGTWSEPAALTGADAVLVTHEHTDHVDVLRLAGLGVPVHAPAGADIPRLETSRVTARLGVHRRGLPRARGGRPPRARPQPWPDCANLGYVVEDAVYHPGDALHLPGLPVETLMVPLQASWLKTAEAIDFVNAVAPRRAFGIHDGQMNERGLSSVNGWLAEGTDHGYRYLRTGRSL